jgi:hypothetical protein
MVHFQQPWTCYLVQQDIKTQDLKSHVVLQIPLLTRLICLRQVRLHSHHCLDHNRLDLLPKLVNIDPLFLQALKNAG